MQRGEVNMKIHSLFNGAALAGLVISASISLAQAGSLKAGAAKIDISPTPDMFPFASGQQYASLHDPIFARALVLDNGVTKLALITVDNTHFNFGDELIKAVTDELKIPAANVVMSATHDHNAPNGGGGFGGPGDAKNPYFKILIKGLVDAAHQANANLQP